MPPALGAASVPSALVKLAKALLAVGRVMITCGVLILLFVVYQLWGTGIHTARAQNDAESEFEQAYGGAIEDAPVEARHSVQEIPHAPPRGGLIGNLSIPAIGANFYFFEGVDLDVLEDGPGHYMGTPLPGEEGNAAIAGHRTTYLAPFNRLDEVGQGDRLVITYPNRSRFIYQYLDTQIVTPDRLDVLQDKGDNRLTTTACNPKYSAAERIVVSWRLLDRATPRAESTQVDQPIHLDDTSSLDGQQHAKSPAILWGLAAASVWLAAYTVARAWRRWPTYLLALPIFLAALYGFFENFSHLLPADF